MKRKITVLLVLLLMVSIVSSSDTGISVKGVEEVTTSSLWQNFVTPPDEYKSRPLWFWNDRLENITKEGIREMMVKSKEQSGYVGFVILPNWINNYMTPQYFELYEYALQTAEELGVKMCLYDENGFPSGSAGGLFAQTYPGDTIKRLDKQEKDFTGPGKCGSIPTGEYRTYLGAVAMNMDTNEIIDISQNVIFADSTIPGVFSSSDHPAIGPNVYTADQAFDGDYNTRWNAGQGNTADQWIEVRYPRYNS